MLSLVMNPGREEERTFLLPVGTVTIGRTKDNLVFCLHKSLSRRHARLEYDGTKVRLHDLQSKNGVFFNGRRVTQCELAEGDTFRCGDILFALESEPVRTKGTDLAQTLPSPHASGPNSPRRVPRSVPSPQPKEKLLAILAATELVVAAGSLEPLLEEVVSLTLNVLTVDRIALLVLDNEALEMRPRVLKNFSRAVAQPYSRRVIDWVVDKGSATAFEDVSRDGSLPGNAREDAHVRAAMCVPLRHGGGTIGVLYADLLDRVRAFSAEDLSFFQGMANLAALAIEADALRRSPPVNAGS